MRRIKLQIDERVVGVSQGTTILEAAAAAGSPVPRLCHVPGLPPRLVCRLCLVRVQGARGMVSACATAVEDGMKVATRDAEIDDMRRTLVEFLLAEHGTCGRRNCDVELLAAALGVSGSRYYAPRDTTPNLGSHYIEAHPELCVHCDRCIRACSRQVITRIGRGAAIRFSFDDGKTLGMSSCMGCGDCVAVCPAGALTAPGLMSPRKPK